MVKQSRDWVAQMPEERQARIAAETQRLIDEMPLQARRRALDLTQQPVAATLGINPIAVSKMEGQTDLYVSTLRRFVEAMGRRTAHHGPLPRGRRRNQPIQAGAGTDRTGGGVKRASGVVSERLETRYRTRHRQEGQAAVHST
jgi:hypothetical protein